MNMSGGWQDYLHWSLLSEHVLVPHLQLQSAWTFTLASLLTVFVCLSERLLTYALSCSEAPRTRRARSPLRAALRRTCLYWLVTFDRMLYMLIAMTFNVGLLVILVTSLSAGQFLIEYRNLTSVPQSPDPESKEPLLASDYYERPAEHASYPPQGITTRPRSKSKPDSIFIHPSESNIARADAAAVSLGLAGDTDLVGLHPRSPSWPWHQP